jgi:integrase/recombinase XerD
VIRGDCGDPLVYRIPEMVQAALIERAGSAAVFPAEEFFYGKIRNEHTRRAYLVAVRPFMLWGGGQPLYLKKAQPRLGLMFGYLPG